MKLRWRILYILLGSLFLLPSCTDEDLDTTMYGGREDTEFYNNLEEINQALTACYFYMKDSWNDMSLELMFINDCASDDCEKGGSGLTNEGDIYQLETFNIFTTNSKVSQFWNMAYRAIYQINTLLDKSEIFRSANTDLTEDDKTLLTRYENEARWLRGVWYFNLAYLWGDVPLFLHAEQPADIYKPRTPVAQIWEQVIADFTAATALPKRSEYSEEDTGRVTSGAAYAMLGRTYWYNRDFENAYKMLYVLVEGEQKGEYELDPDFATQWLNPNSNLRESIFEIQYVTNGKNWDESTGWNGVWFIPSSDGGYGFHLPTQHLLDAFDPEDPRITWTFVRQGDQFVGNDFVTGDANYPSRFFDRKHFVPMSETLNAASPVYPQDVEMTVYVIRYADVLLMYAEAQTEYLNKAQGQGTISDETVYAAIEQVRERAGLNPYTLKRNMSYEELIKIIRNERRCEFAFEESRFWDIRRWKIAEDVYSKPLHGVKITKNADNTFHYDYNMVVTNPFWDNRMYRLPIDNNEVLYNPNIKQNPGY